MNNFQELNNNFQELNNNLNKLNNNNLNKPIIDDYLNEVSDNIKELNIFLKNILENNENELEKLKKNLFIEKKSVEPFIKYLIFYNYYLNNIYD